MKSSRFFLIRICTLLLLGSGVVWCRFVPGAGEWYARTIYPGISFTLSGISSLVSFSLCEIMVMSAVLYLFVYPFVWWNKKSHRQIVCHELELLAWLAVWFYWAWGINYFRDNFYIRSGISPVQFEESRFRDFLMSYTDSLNDSYIQCSSGSFCFPKCEEEIKSLYQEIPEKYGLTPVYSFQHPKKSIVNNLYSSVGVLGYIGPFFAESHINHDLLPEQYPFTFAHEFSHLLGISSEAEANFWAYQICLHSSDAFVRYSGYLGILPYVLSNARGILGQSDFQIWVKMIHPEIIAQFMKSREYWKDKYSVWLGRIQSELYDFYLKGNRISSGQKNYAEVLGMILAFPDNEKW